jgi:hypothetical protein
LNLNIPKISGVAIVERICLLVIVRIWNDPLSKEPQRD